MLNAQKLLERLSAAGRDAQEDVDVTFTFSHHDFDYLSPLAEEMGDLFADKLDVECDSVVIGYDQHPQVKDAEGQQEAGSPRFTLTFVGPLTADQFALLHELAAKLATQHKMTYLGAYGWCG